jgi:hypothetical protein
MLRWTIASCVLMSGTGALAAESCPSFLPGQLYPWQQQSSDKPMPGDQWAWLYIDVDVNGKPKNCKVGDHKYEPETGFWMCRAVMASGQFEPVKKDGVVVEGTVKRYFTVAGRARKRADEAARKQWFKDHPQERPACYPD